MFNDLGSGFMNQVGDAALGHMGTQVFTTGRQLMNDNVCFFSFICVNFILSYLYGYLLICLDWALYDIITSEILL